MNVVLDFTANKSLANVTANQPVALMPASLAKRLLEMYAARLVKADTSEIIAAFKGSIDVYGTVTEAVQVALEFVQERELIDNIQAGYWDTYAVGTDAKIEMTVSALG